MALSRALQQQKLRSQNSQAKKFFEAVPINDIWGLVKIGGEVMRLYGIKVDMSDLQGGLVHLEDVGLIKRSSDGWRRAPVREDVEAAEIRQARQVIKPAPMLAPVENNTFTLDTTPAKTDYMTTEKLAATTQSTTASVRGMITAMSDQLRKMSGALATMADEAEVIVELMEEEQAGLREKLASMDRQVQAAKQLQAAMAGFAAATIN